MNVKYCEANKTTKIRNKKWKRFFNQPDYTVALCGIATFQSYCKIIVVCTFIYQLYGIIIFYEQFSFPKNENDIPSILCIHGSSNIYEKSATMYVLDIYKMLKLLFSGTRNIRWVDRQVYSQFFIAYFCDRVAIFVVRRIYFP